MNNQEISESFQIKSGKINNQIEDIMKNEQSERINEYNKANPFFNILKNQANNIIEQNNQNNKQEFNNNNNNNPTINQQDNYDSKKQNNINNKIEKENKNEENINKKEEYNRIKKNKDNTKEEELMAYYGLNDERMKNRFRAKVNNKDKMNIITVPKLSQIVIKDFNLNYSDIINKINLKKKKNPINSNNDIIRNNLNNKYENPFYSLLKLNQETPNPFSSKISNNNQTNQDNKYANPFYSLLQPNSDNNKSSALNTSLENPYYLPSKIHNHPLTINSLIGECCSLCLTKKVCQKGNKCLNCLLIICDECSLLINNYYNLHKKHEHSLTLLSKQMCKFCNEVNNNQFYAFRCDKCNFEICPKCYLSKK